MRLLRVLFVLAMYFGGSVTQTCKTFEEIPEEDYDRTYAGIHETDKRPLGFVRETVPYNNEAIQNPCYSLVDVSGRQVEIMYETVPSTMLCFRNLANTTSCYDGRHRECKYGASNTATISFYCDVASGCSESAVNFWLRITVGPPPEEDSEGMWCMNRDSEYPEDLAPLPPDFNPTTTPADPNKGYSIAAQKFIMMVAFVCSFLMHL